MTSPPGLPKVPITLLAARPYCAPDAVSAASEAKMSTPHSSVRPIFLARQYASARLVFWVGTLLALLGFLMPWFGVSPNWSFGGLHLIRYEGMPWLWLLVAGYGVALVCGLWGLDREGSSKAVVVLVLALFMTTLIIVGFAAAAAVDGVRDIDQPQWRVGMIPLVLGHAMMLLGAMATYFFRVLADFSGTEIDVHRAR